MALPRKRRFVRCGWSRYRHSRRQDGFRRKKRQDVCPLRTGGRELAKLRRDARPWTKLPLENTGAVTPISAILVSCRNHAGSPYKFSPVFEKDCGLKRDVRGFRIQPGSANRFPPTLKVAQHLVLGHPGRSHELPARRGATENLRGLANGIEHGVLFRCRLDRHFTSDG